MQMKSLDIFFYKKNISYIYVYIIYASVSNLIMTEKKQPRINPKQMCFYLDL